MTQIWIPPEFWQMFPNIWWGKDSFFNKCWWENWISACRNLTLDPWLSSCIRINLKSIKDLNISSETLKLVQVRAGNNLELIGICNDFSWNVSDSVTKRKNKQMGLHEIKKLLYNKRNVSKLKSLLQTPRKSLPSIHLTRVW
jgi:hypothetical protein